ncbi:uncharacterized protein Met75Ca [Drosophila takahashii]|uniref:uncharacterized protein Met75Ca n=1 Tax=Drosophila takahashii TaxID=29030 RepID=UPI001CF7FF66|nr:uncharacterized protein LOC108065194 [Drosophila takahashii]
MNAIQVCALFFLSLVLSTVNAQIPTREESSRDKACGPGRYYNEARHTCLPW